MNSELQRMGFEAWADNKVVNFIEDHGGIIAMSSEGYTQVEKNNYSICSSHKGIWINIVLRAYIDGQGWKTRDWNIKRITQNGVATPCVASKDCNSSTETPTTAHD